MFGWDVGGAHVKACRLVAGSVAEVVQWACPLWRGEAELERVLREAHARWPGLARAAHAITMTGEMADHFASRAQGVARIAAILGRALAPGTLHFHAGVGLWCPPAHVTTHWERIASANWLATAAHAASVIEQGVLVDIGSTTTDLIAFRGGQVLRPGRSDAERLATGELVYHGVARTPLCALGPRIGWRGVEMNVMNEFFATSADVYRLTGELDPAHDPHPSADGAAKELPATRRRLARMIGMEEDAATERAWLDFALAWREKQVDELAGQLRRVIAANDLPGGVALLGAGCGDFLLADVQARSGGSGRRLAYGRDVAAVQDPGLCRWAQVCAPSVAVACLFDRQQR